MAGSKRRKSNRGANFRKTAQSCDNTPPILPANATSPPDDSLGGPAAPALPTENTPPDAPPDDLLGQITNCAIALSKLEPKLLSELMFQLCDELGGISQLKEIVMALRKNEAFVKIDINDPPPTASSFSLSDSSRLLRLLALEGMPSKPLDSLFMLSKEKAEFTRFSLVSNEEADFCIIYRCFKDKLKAFTNLNYREKKNSLTLPCQNTTLFRALNFLKDNKFYGTDAEFIRNSTPTSNATPSNAAPAPAPDTTIIHRLRVGNVVPDSNKLPLEIFFGEETDLKYLFRTTYPKDPVLKLFHGLRPYNFAELYDVVYCINFDRLGKDWKQKFNQFFKNVSNNIMVIKSPIMHWAALNQTTRINMKLTGKQYLTDALRKALLFLYAKREELPEKKRFVLDPNNREEILKAFNALSYLFLSNNATLQAELMMAICFKVSENGEYFETITGDSPRTLSALRWTFLKIVELNLQLHPETYTELEKNPPNFSEVNMANLIFYNSAILLKLHDGDLKTVVKRTLEFSSEGEVQLPVLLIGGKLLTTELFTETLRVATDTMVESLIDVLKILKIEPMKVLLKNDKKRFSATLSSEFASTGKGAKFFIKGEDGDVQAVWSIEKIGETIRRAIFDFDLQDLDEFLSFYQTFQEAKLVVRFMQNASRAGQFATATLGDGQHMVKIRAKVRAERASE